MDDKISALKLKLSDLGCHSVIKMIFFDNLVHGDMHPGKLAGLAVGISEYALCQTYLVDIYLFLPAYIHT